MRALVTAFVAVLAIAPAGSAKESDPFALALAPRATAPATICGSSHAVAHARAGTRVRATIRMRTEAPARRTPFVLAIRRCTAGHFTTLRRVRVALPAGRRTVTVALPRLRAGEYRVEALLNGDRPPLRSAIGHLVVTGAGDTRPRILSVAYGRFQPRGAPHAYTALRLRMRDPDGQVVGLQWTQLSPKPDREGVGIADGGCGLGTPSNGAVGTWYLPMELAAGAYRFQFELTSSPCSGSGENETVRQTVEFSAG